MRTLLIVAAAAFAAALTATPASAEPTCPLPLPVPVCYQLPPGHYACAWVDGHEACLKPV